MDYLKLGVVVLAILLLGGCVSEPYSQAFSACDDRAGACYRNCEVYAGGRNFSSCHRDCEYRANRCFDAAYGPYRSTSVTYGYGAGWSGRYGAWHPAGGYTVFVTIVDGRSYYGRRRDPYYRDPYYRDPDYRDPYYGGGRDRGRDQDRDRDRDDDREGDDGNRGAPRDPDRQRERDQNMATGVWRGEPPAQRPPRSTAPATSVKTPPPTPGASRQTAPSPSRQTEPVSSKKTPPPTASRPTTGSSDSKTEVISEPGNKGPDD